MNYTLIETKKAEVGKEFPTSSPDKTFQLSVESATVGSVVSATGIVEVSNDRKVWFPFCMPMTVTGTVTADITVFSDYWPPVSAAWAFARASITDISGDNAVATLSMGM